MIEKTNETIYIFNHINDSDIVNSYTGDDNVGINTNSIIDYMVGKYDIETEIIIGEPEEGCLVYLGLCSLGGIYTRIPTNRYTILEYHLNRDDHNKMIENYHVGDWKRVITSCMTLSDGFGGLLKTYYQLLKQSIAISK